MAQMRKIVTRQKEISWLSRVWNTGEVIGVQGLQGSGKTSLIKDFLQLQNVQAKWVQFGAYFNQEIIGLSMAESIDASFHVFQKFISSSDVFVWDDFHLLSEKDRSLLIYFLQQTKDRKKHIILSDERSDHFENILSTTISGLSKQEVSEYFKIIGMDVSPTELERIFEHTQGLIGMLQILIQHPNFESSKIQLPKSVTKDFEEELSLFAVYPRPLKTSEIFDELSINSQAIKRMQEKFLIDFNEETNEITLVPFIRQIILESFSRAKLKLIARKIAENQHLVQELSQNQILKLSLLAENFDSTIHSMTPFKVENLDLLSNNEREKTEKRIEQLLSDKQQGNEIVVLLNRALIHLFILSGKRNQALKICRQVLEEYHFQSDHAYQALVIESISWIQKSNIQFDLTKILSEMINKTKPPHSWLLKIEQIMPFVYREPDRAIVVCKSVLSEIARFNSIESDQTINHVKAHTYYQLATAMNQKAMYIESEAAYGEAEKLYRSVGKNYFELFSLFNRSWIFYNQGESVRLKESLERLYFESKVYGYHYLKAASLWLMANSSIDNYDLFQALDQIEEGISYLEQATPERARIDLFLTKVRALMLLGKNQEALQELTNLENTTSTSKTNLSIQILKAILKSDTTAIDEIIEFSSPNDEKFINLDAELFLLERGIESIKSNRLPQNRRTRLADLQFKIIQSIRQSEFDILKQQLHHFDEELKQIRFYTDLHAASAILNIRLVSNEKKPSAVQRAELVISALASNLNTISFFKSWLLVETEKNSDRSMNHSGIFFENSFCQLRWNSWLPKKQSKYEVYSLKGAETTDELVNPRPGKIVTYLEPTGQVFWGKKEVTDFSRKPVLRQLLGILLGNYPESISKAGFSMLLWGEEYDPTIHDSRIYTSIQRLRSYFSNECIQTSELGYRWSYKKEFYYVKSIERKHATVHRVKTQIIEALLQRKRTSNPWVKRSELVEMTGSSDATVKRMLSELITDKKVHREGTGPSVRYQLAD